MGILIITDYLIYGIIFTCPTNTYNNRYAARDLILNFKTLLNISHDYNNTTLTAF